jgi:transcriptional regulator with XRE-family HTH domain
MNSRVNRRPTPADIRFGQRMRTRRMSLGLSQTELADALDVTFQQIQKYEKGVTCVRVSAVETLAARLKVPVAFFFDGSNQRNGSGSDLTDFMATSEGIALCSAFRQIESKGMRNAVIDLLQRLITKH